jgi:hypothetical protein
MGSMKKILLILMTLALAVNAHAMSDAEMKALLTGTWTDPCEDLKIPGATEIKTTVFEPDGKWRKNADDKDPYYKWDIQKGELLEIVPDHNDPSGTRARHSFTILFLTEHEFLAEANFGDGRSYMFLTRD